MKLSKHDEVCLSRRDQPGWKWLCTCGMTDEQVAKVITKSVVDDRTPLGRIVTRMKQPPEGRS